MHRDVPDKTKIWSDNQGAIQLAKNPVFHSRTKHIGVHYNFTKDLVVNKEIQIEYVPTENMIADIFTKALDREKHTKFSLMMGLLPLSMIESGARGCVEQNALASLCVLTTQSCQKITHDMSQQSTRIRACHLEIDDPQLPEVQANEHKDHARTMVNHRQKQYNQRKVLQEGKCSSKELSEIIDANARELTNNIRGAFRMNARKRKRSSQGIGMHKKQRLYKQSKRQFLSCFVLGHPWMVTHHIHKNRENINRASL